jgi:hypothetical protein
MTTSGACFGAGAFGHAAGMAEPPAGPQSPAGRGTTCDAWPLQLNILVGIGRPEHNQAA